jgi:hypothetical protein
MLAQDVAHVAKAAIAKVLHVATAIAAPHAVRILILILAATIADLVAMIVVAPRAKTAEISNAKKNPHHPLSLSPPDFSLMTRSLNC